ncbi:transposase [Streptomyces sp. CB00316]|uniref:transposase n=1 Tax=Streptomyces sp. CB00316 TaxID=1703932 RepID=UPI001F214961
MGQLSEYELRDIMDAILYVDRAGVRRRYLPYDFPHWNSVYGYFANAHGPTRTSPRSTVTRQLLQEKESWLEAEHLHRHTRSCPGGAGHCDQRAGLRRCRPAHRPGRRRPAWNPQRPGSAAATADTSSSMQPPSASTWKPPPIPKRWAVERATGWLMLHRRLARDYETLPPTSKPSSTSPRPTSRPTREHTISWRDPKKITEPVLPG